MLIKRTLYGTDINNNIPARCFDEIISIDGICGNGHNAYISMDSDMLCKGMSLLGQTGIGKTHLCLKVIQQLRANMTEAYSMVVIQVKDDFLDCYREGDVIIGQGKYAGEIQMWNCFRDLLFDGWGEINVERNCREFAEQLFSDKQNQSQQFFVDGAKLLLYSVLLTYINRARNSLSERSKLSNKGLRDFFVKYSPEQYKNLMQDCVEPGLLRMVLGDDVNNLQALGVMGEAVTTVINCFTDVFAEDGDFSIREFVHNKKGKTLFINYDPAYKDTQTKVYKSMVNMMLKEVLSQNASKGKTIFICDELPVIGKVDLSYAVNLGRAKGFVCIVGFQSIEQIYSTYGEKDGNVLLAGLCSKLFFKPNDPASRKHITDYFGKGILEYIDISPGGTRIRREEGNLVDDTDILNLRVGDCFVGLSNGEMFKIHIA